MKNLNFAKISSLDHLVYPDSDFDLNLESPALMVMTNFRRERPMTVDTTFLAAEAHRLMTSTHTNILLVADKQMELAGVINIQRLSERHIVRLVADGTKRTEITVADLMIARNQIHALDFDNVCESKISDIIAVMMENGQTLCLVVDNIHHHICGLFYASEISRRLHNPINIESKPTFSGMLEAMAH